MLENIYIQIGLWIMTIGSLLFSIRKHKKGWWLLIGIIWIVLFKAPFHYLTLPFKKRR